MDEGKRLREAMDAVSGDALDDVMSRAFRANAAEGDRQDGESTEYVGRYKLLEQIGEGGFGVVYLAEQQEPIRRRVALKIIKLGMDTKEVVARFEAERQALAMMAHDNIASVLDAGATESGRPFFVMELVRGVPITEYCDRNKLNTEDRLRLFVLVCQAVQHAHQKGIIHRDLKPNNVMVTLRDGGPIPKVIDFGIAKATQFRLTEKTVFTRFGQFIGTPAYMSPEQVEMGELDIDTRSDVYSLGVLLYELLTGTTPIERTQLDRASYSEMQRLICEREPPKPSSRLSQSGATLASISAKRATEPKKLGQLLRGDLDWIAIKALEKDRTRRYETANGLAADVLRHLDGEPVSAGPLSAAYKLRKFSIRHKELLATAAVILVALLIASIVSSVMAVRAMRAESAANDERDVSDRLRRTADRQRDDMRWNLYRAEMKVAQQVFRMPNGNEHFRAILDKWRVDQPDLRGWEWYYLNSLLHRELMTLDGHVDAVTSVCYSPNGQLLATASRDRTVRIWDSATGKNVQTMKGHLDDVFSVCFSPDGRQLASASADKTVKVWDVSSGEERLSLAGHTARVRAVSWHPDGTWIASAGDDTTVRIWKTEGGHPDEVLQGHTEGVATIAWNDNGSLLASASHDDTILLWDPKTWEHQRPFKKRKDTLSLAWHDDGRRLATTNLDDPTIRVWDIRTGEESALLMGHTNYAHATAWNPDGTRLVSAGEDGTLRMWNATTGLEMMVLHVSVQRSVSWSRDGEQFASGGDDGIVRIWSATNGQGPKSVIDGGPDVWTAMWSPDGNRLAIGCADNTVQVWDATSGDVRVIGHHDGRAFSVGWSCDGQLASGGYDGQVKIFDAAGGERLNLPAGSDVFSVAWSPDGTRLAAAGGTQTVEVWHASTGEKIQTFAGHTSYLTGVCWNKTGTRIASSSADRTVRVWDSASREEKWSVFADSQQVNGLSWSPDGKRLAASAADDTDVKILDSDSGRQMLRLAGHTEWVFMTRWSPNGRRLASASADGTVKIWDASTGQETITLRGHTQFVRSISWHPDGRRLVSAGRDGKVLIWDASRGYIDDVKK